MPRRREIMPETICPFCRKSYPADFKWCMDDGSELEQNIGQYDEVVDEIPKVPCPDCGEMIDPRDVYCGACGSRVAGRLPKVDIPGVTEPEISEEEYVSPEAPAAPTGQTRECPNCGATIAADDVFCGECGSKVEAAAASAPSYSEDFEGKHCLSCAAAIDPGEQYCGVCGEKVPDGFWDTPAAAPAPAVTAAPAPAVSATVSCPNCGAAIASDDAFCGECGNQVTAAVSAAPPPPPVAPQQMAPPTVCPSCSADIVPGDVFCGTCGHNLAETVEAPPDLAGPEPEFIGEPEPEPVVIVDPFGGRGMRKMDIDCPNCGLKIPHDADVCSVCGYDRNNPPEPAAAPVEQVSGALCPSCGGSVEPGEAFCGNCGSQLSGAPATAEPEPEKPKRSISEMTADVLICAECGQEGLPGQDACMACGGVLKTQAELDAMYAQIEEPTAPAPPPAIEINPEPEPAAPSFTPPPPPPPPVPSPAPAAPAAAPASGAGDKICSCCGSSCPPDTEFCPNCGVDFD